MTLGWLSYGHYWQQHFGRGPFVCGWPSAKVPNAEDTYVLAHVETELLFLLTLATVTICQLSDEDTGSDTFWLYWQLLRVALGPKSQMQPAGVYSFNPVLLGLEIVSVHDEPGQCCKRRL